MLCKGLTFLASFITYTSILLFFATVSAKLEELLTKVLTDFVDHRKPLVRQVS